MILHQRGEARDAKWHEEQPENLPRSEARVLAGSRSAEVQREAHNGAQADRSEPNPRTSVEISDEHEEVPQEIAPENLPRCAQAG